MLPERNVKVSWKDLYRYDQMIFCTKFGVKTLFDRCSNPKVFTFFFKSGIDYVSALDISTCWKAAGSHSELLGRKIFDILIFNNVLSASGLNIQQCSF